jgi:hypothetical protein
MVVVVGAVLARMHVVVGLCIRAVFVGVLVLMHVPVAMGVGVRMGMLPDPGMLVLVGVLVSMLVGVLVAVFVISLHFGSSSYFDQFGESCFREAGNRFPPAITVIILGTAVRAPSCRLPYRQDNQPHFL